MPIDLSDIKVLLVEDDHLMRNFVKLTLKRIGISKVVECSDGGQAIEEATDFLPDLILIDIHMSPMNGVTFVQKLRLHAVPSVRKSKVIVMSADSRRQTPDSALANSASAFIYKPPRINDLKAKIEAALRE